VSEISISYKSLLTDEEDLVLNKPTSQEFFQVETGLSNWWQVYLQKIYTIGRIVIFNKNDACGDTPWCGKFMLCYSESLFPAV